MIEFHKIMSSGSTLLTLGLASIPVISGQSQKKPNVVLILTDDQGYGDFGFTGNHHVRTPFLDSLAAESYWFRNFYVSPVSAPTRSSLMTGRYSLRTGIRDTYNGGAIMASSEVTIAEILRREGYSTGHFGKWHLGDNYPCRPIDQGFDESVMHLGGGMGQPGDVSTYFRSDSSYFNPVLWHNGKQQKFTGYCSDIFTDNAVRFIENNRHRPFFCYLAFNAPHTPLQLPEEYYKMYRDTDPSSGFVSTIKTSMSEQEKEDARKVYGMVTNIDYNIGRVLSKLKELGISDNTIIVFLTDNGPQQRRYLAGMRGLKGSVYNGGVKVPLLIRYPALSREGKEVMPNAAHIDILPTIAELCNADLDDGIKRDGLSLVPAMTGKGKINSEREIFTYWTRKYPEMYFNMSVLKGDYKLTGQTDFDSPLNEFEVYNLKTDPGESANLVNDQPETGAGLRATMDKILTELASSENIIDPPRIVIGNENENPVILNRNDADGERGIWDQEEIYGKWRVMVSEGYYNICIRFIKPVLAGGNLMIEAGTIISRKRNLVDNAETIELRNVKLPGQEYDLTAFYESGGKRIFPFSIEILKVGNLNHK